MATATATVPHKIYLAGQWVESDDVLEVENPARTDLAGLTYNATPEQYERAVSAAAALQAESGRIAAQHPEWPRFRAAVNSGEALVGVVGAESGRSYTVIGDTVNVAARLESRAPTGGVVIGGATLRAVPGVRATSLGEIEVKGKRERVDAYLLDARAG